MLGQVCPSSRAPQLGTEDSAASTGKLGHPPRPGIRPVQAPDQTSESKFQNSRGTRRGEPVIIHLQWALDILISTGNRTRGRVHIHGTAILPKVHNVISIQQQGATQLQSSGLPSPAPNPDAARPRPPGLTSTVHPRTESPNSSTTGSKILLLGKMF